MKGSSSVNDRLAPLGRTGFEVTRVGLGAWAIGGPWERGWGAQDDRDSVATIVHAVESGINWIDTAAVYGLGHAEEVIADALDELGGGTERPLVLTKCGRTEGMGGDGKIGAPAVIRQGCEESLRRLRVECLDLLQLHYPPADGTPLELTWETMAELQAEGKVAFLGACNCTPEELDRIDAVAPVEVVQPPLSMINRAALEQVVPWARERGRGVLVYSPMQSGLLTGGFQSRIGALDADDWRLTDPQFQEPNLSRNLDLVERLRPLAERLGASVSELAIAWTLARPGVTGAIVGARRPDQVDGWRGATAVALDTEADAAVSAAIEASGAGWGPVPDLRGVANAD